MSSTTARPIIPPRPSHKQTMPIVPPRPVNKSIEHSMSPNRDRFAPSPLNESPFQPKSLPVPSRLGGNNQDGDSVHQSTSVDMPAVGEEGREYACLAEHYDTAAELSSSPEHTRTVGEDVKLHAPKPSLPAKSAKQRVLAVTRTSSERAASFGIGRPSSVAEEVHVPPRTLKKKASNASQLSTGSNVIEDEHGIPEIGQQVPMYPKAGDVQAPSPAPGSTSGAGEGLRSKHHSRKNSARGFLPPGSYGLHGHGVFPQDKLVKAYYEKHPSLLQKEHEPYHAGRPFDFSLTSEDLNRIVRETANRNGLGIETRNYAGTPTDEVGWQAIEETTSRVASPGLSLKQTSSGAATETTASRGPAEGETIHVDEPGQRKSVMFSDDEASIAGDVEHPYKTPILAEDEVAKHPTSSHNPAVQLRPERRGSAFEMDEPSSRGTSRPTSLHRESSYEIRSTPLEDVDEYEPLFPEEHSAGHAPSPELLKSKPARIQRFPSRDVWEDAPDSVHYSAEVSTDDLSMEETDLVPSRVAPPPREGAETPAQAFARHQEELAEKEVGNKHGPDGNPGGRPAQKPLWVQHQAHLKDTGAARPAMSQRFPSQDVWEDTPDSLKLEATVSCEQEEERPEMPERLQKKHSQDETSSASEKAKPVLPERPKPRQASGDDTSSKPAVPERPKPQMPARPAKAGPTSGGLEPAEAAVSPKPKPAVPVRPAGSKIAALQAGFMSDLNKRLRLGPQAPKKAEEQSAGEDAPVEEKEKAPLSDARKGRARGPQRRVPAAQSPSSVVADSKPVLFSFSTVTTVWEVDPENEKGMVLARCKDIGADLDPISESQDTKSDETTELTLAQDDLEHDPGELEETKTLATNMAGEPVIEEHET